MNDFFSELLLSTLKNVNSESYTKESLLEKLKSDFDSDIEEYDIIPILEKCIEKNALYILDNGLIIITEVGLSLLSNPSSAYQTLWSISTLSSTEERANPHEKKHLETLNHLNEAYQSYLSDLKKHLKYLLINMDDYKFEELVVDLLIQSGEAPFGEVTKKSGDGGIDGFLYKTRLKQGVMPIQSKCNAESNLVGLKDMKDFVGSMHQSHRNGAYFVTTSTFTRQAIEKANEHGIILIDGNQLVYLLVEYQYGLEIRNNLEFLLSPVLSLFE